LKRINIGIVGAGGIFRGAHLPSYPKVKEARIVSLCDISDNVLKTTQKMVKKTYLKANRKANEEGKGEIAERLKEDMEGLKTYTNYSEMLSKEELDLVDVCTPTKFHSLMAIEALKQSVNVMVEKPMARTYLECIDVVESVKETGKLYQHNENWLYSPFIYNARKFIESGIIGELQLIFLHAAHEGAEGASWFWNPDLAGGGALLDMGIHAITGAWFLTGFNRKPTIVKATEPYGVSIRMKTRILKGMFKPFKVEDDAHISIRFEDEEKRWSTAQIEGSWSYRDSMDTTIIGTNGTIRPIQKEEDTILEINHVGGVKKDFNLGKVKETENFAMEIRNMCNCVLNNTKPLCNEMIGTESTAIVQAAYLSQKKGRRPVTLKDFKKYALKIREKEGKDASETLLKELLDGIKRM
jgi:predicted dehydrogenase